MEQSLNHHIQFKYHRPTEFLSTMYVVANWNSIEKVRIDFQDEFYEEHHQMVKQMMDQLSRYLRSELEFFFQTESVTSPEPLFEYVYEFHEVQTVPELIDNIRASSEAMLLRVLLGGLVDAETLTPLRAELRDIMHDDDSKRYQEVRALVQLEVDRLLQSTDNPFVERIEECVRFPAEAKLRLVRLLEGFYLSVYQPLEATHQSMAELVSPEYERLFRENPEHFFAELVKLDPGSFTKRTQIHISPANPSAGFVAFTDSRPKAPNWVRIGTRVLHEIQHREDRKLVERFCKALSDGRRLDIIRKLFDRPCYGQELAQALSLTPAAITYHLEFLMELGFVSPRKEDHRIYYHINPSKLEDLFDLAKLVIIPPNARSHSASREGE